MPVSYSPNLYKTYKISTALLVIALSPFSKSTTNIRSYKKFLYLIAKFTAYI